MLARLHTLVFSICCAQSGLIATVVRDPSPGQHGTVSISDLLKAGAAGEDDQFRLALSGHFQSLLEPQHVLVTFQNVLEPRVDRLWRLFVFFVAPNQEQPLRCLGSEKESDLI